MRVTDYIDPNTGARLTERAIDKHRTDAEIAGRLGVYAVSTRDWLRTCIDIGNVLRAPSPQTPAAIVLLPPDIDGRGQPWIVSVADNDEGRAAVDHAGRFERFVDVEARAAEKQQTIAQYLAAQRKELDELRRPRARDEKEAKWLERIKVADERAQRAATFGWREV